MPGRNRCSSNLGTFNSKRRGPESLLGKHLRGPTAWQEAQDPRASCRKHRKNTGRCGSGHSRAGHRRWAVGCLLLPCSLHRIPALEEQLQAASDPTAPRPAGAGTWDPGAFLPWLGVTLWPAPCPLTLASRASIQESPRPFPFIWGLEYFLLVTAQGCACPASSGALQCNSHPQKAAVFRTRVLTRDARSRQSPAPSVLGEAHTEILSGQGMLVTTSSTAHSRKYFDPFVPTGEPRPCALGLWTRGEVGVSHIRGAEPGP